MPTRRIAPVLFLLLALSAPRPWASAAAEDPAPADPAAVEFFETKVRPILVKRCYECHSAEAKRLRGGLRLDSKPGWAAGGDSGPAIEPGNPDESLLVEAIRYEEAAGNMPPSGKLPDDEIATLTEWVRRGAPDPRLQPPAATQSAGRVIDLEAERDAWAYRPLRPVAPPAVRDEAWVRNPIDRFILAKLEAKGIVPAAPAARRQLIRRASFDLTGLPPTPEEVEAFVEDSSPDAYETVIDRLLASPHHGERWARHWLDLARFAESHGFEHDYDRPTAYHYRDFLIEAFNRDLPYDTFVKWQLAGDEYEPDNNLALKATGFLGAGTHSTQITANQVEKERYDELDDMANTTGTAFLGLTIGCARCHDHKFDPIPQEDYYRLVSTFTTTVRSEVELRPDQAKFRQEQEKYEREHAPYVEALARFEAEQLPSRLERWEATRDRSRSKPDWVVLTPSKFTSTEGAQHKVLEDGSVLVSGKNPDFDTYTIVAACDLPELTAIRVEALADESLPKGGPGRAGNGNFALTDVQLKVGPRYGIGKTVDARLINPKASFEQDGLPIRAAVDEDPKSGWAVDPQFGKSHAAAFEIGSDIVPDGGATLTVTLAFANNQGHNIGRVRLSVTGSPRPVGLDDDGIPADVAPILAVAAAERTPEQRAALLGWYKTIDTEWRARNAAIEDHARLAPKSDGVKALICTEGLPAVRLHTQGGDFLEKTHLLKRGDPNQKLREVTQGFLQVLVDAPEKEARWQLKPPEGWRTSYRRRALAEWITDTDAGAGRLLARVAVNRLWQHHFGRGIVATPSDFGVQGEKPTHPELLDWLAVELIQGGWRLKPLHKLMMTSATYLQGVQADEAAVAADRENALFGRRDRARLEAEAIRDALLATAGMLDTRMYGPGTLNERMTRRSLYFMVKRSRLIPMMVLFDAPDALTPVAVRPTTTIAPQSLLLMNSPIIRDWAAGFARRVAPDEGSASLEESVRRAYRIALARPPADDELRDALAFLDGQAASHRAAGHADPERTALTDFCQVLMSLNEFLFIE